MSQPNAIQLSTIPGLALGDVAPTKTFPANPLVGEAVDAGSGPPRYLPFINVKDFGAAGDGATDDTAAIQAAIDAALLAVAGTTGGTVYLPRGVYKVSTLRWGSNMTICGDGNYATTIDQIAGTASYMLGPKAEGTASLRSTLRDLILTGFHNQAANRGIVELLAFSDTRIERCHLTYGRGSIVRIAGWNADPSIADAMHNKILNCTFGSAIPITVVGDTHTNTTIDNIADTSSIRPGMAITGAGIPDHTTVWAVAANSVTLSQATTATAAGVAITLPAYMVQLSNAAAGGSHPDRALIMGNYFSGSGANSGVLRVDPPLVDAVGALAADGVRFSHNDIVGVPIWLDIQGGQMQRIIANTFENTAGTATNYFGPGTANQAVRDVGLIDNAWITHSDIASLVWKDATNSALGVWETGGWDSGNNQRERGGRDNSLIPGKFREAEVCTLDGDIFRLTGISAALTSGVVFGCKAKVRTSGIYTRIRCLVSNVGAGITDLRLGVGDGLWNKTAETAESHALLVGTGWLTLNLIAPVTLAQGDVISLWVGSIGATGPALRGATFGTTGITILGTIAKQNTATWTTGNALPNSLANGYSFNVTPMLELLP